MSLLGKKDSPQMVAKLRDSYIPLVNSFLEYKISADDFYTAYMKLFLQDEAPSSFKTFAILQLIFEDLDAYDPDPTPGDPFEIGEAELRRCCAENLEKLKRIVESNQ